MPDGEVVYRITGDDSGLGQSLDSASDKISKKTAIWTAVANKALDGITNLAVKAGNGVKMLIQNSIDYNSQMETYTTSFTTMLGSATAATAKVDELKTMAAKTPFAMTDLANATQTLLAFGVSNEKSTAALKMLGDISQGDANKLSSLSLAFGQVSSAGKLSGQDLLQMINAGYNPLRDLSDKTGASIGDLKEKMAGGKGSKEFQAQIKAAQKEVKKLGDNASEGSKMLAQMGTDGYISADLVTQAMESATSEGGLFFRAMEKQSKTFAGQLSTLKDDFNSLNADVFSGLYADLSTNVMPLASGYLSQLSSAFKSGGATGLVSAIGNVLGDAISKVTIAFPKVLKTVNSLIKSLLKGFRDNKTEIANGLAETLAVAAEGIVDIVPDMLSLLMDIGGELLTSLSDELPTLLPELIESLLDFLADMLSEDSVNSFIDTAVTIITNLADALLAAAPLLIEKIPAILSGLVNGFIENFDKIIDAGAGILAKIWNALTGDTVTADDVKSFFSDLWTTVSGYAQGAVDAGAGVLAQIWTALSGDITTAEDVKGFFKSLWDSIWNGDFAAKFLAFIQDNQTLFSELGTVLKTFITGAVDIIVAAIKWIIDNWDAFKLILVTIAATVGAIAIAINPIPAAIGLVGTAAVLLIANWDSLKTATENTWAAIVGWVNTAITDIKEFLGLADKASTVHVSASGTTKGGGGKSFDTDTPSSASAAAIIATKSLGHAAGAIITGGKRLLSQDGTRNLVGEAGAEGIIPLDTLWYEMDSRLQNTMNKTLGALASVPSQTAIPNTHYREIDYDLLASKIAVSVSGGDVYLDGKIVGKIVTPYVSERQGAEYASLQRSGSRL